MTKTKQFSLTGDEQADTVAFEGYVGGVLIAQRLFHIWKDTFPRMDNFFKQIPKSTLFQRRALIEGFNQDQIDAALTMFQ